MSTLVYLVSQNLVKAERAKVEDFILNPKSKMIEESVLIWMVVKDAAPDIIKAGGNPIEVKTRKKIRYLFEY